MQRASLAMPFDESFMQPCPPLTETFSFRRFPCLFEQRSQGPVPAPQPGAQECRLIQYCEASSRALWRLELVYGPWVKVTLAEPSSSIVVRSEHQYNKDERGRLALRKHVYELSADHGTSQGRLRREPITIGPTFANDLPTEIPDRTR